MRRGRRAQDLRLAIDCMPLPTRRAMLEGIDSTPIIVGGYTDRDGGVCPMLAAHRNGGRTAFASFAHAWDRYTKAGEESRRASEGELRTLRAMLESSIAIEGSVGTGPMAEAIAGHRDMQVTRARREEFDVEPMDPIASPSLSPARTGPLARSRPAMSTAGP